MRGRTVYRETGRKETRGEREEKRGRKKREGRNDFLESSSICNTGITSIFQNLPVSAILIFWQ
jgi:hypothetical protein